MVPPYVRLVYDYTNPMWVPSAMQNPLSNCLKGSRKQNRIDILDWTLEIKEVSLILNLGTSEISLMGIKLPCYHQKGSPTDTIYKGNNCLGTATTLSII